MASVTPMQVYQDLLNAGASTVQAIGILANSINESGINPESVGDQGTSFGFVQQHGNYGYLVTGNPTSDIEQQISTVKSLGGFSAASGSSGAQAAGNFSAEYEKCVGCQVGGAQYEQRVNNAATVEGWIKSGNWPTSAGSSTSSGNPGTPNAATTSSILDPFGNIGGDLINSILSALGIPTLTDLAERVGLVLFGAALIFLGIHLLASGGKQPFNINVSEESGPGGTTRKRTVKTPVSIHSKSVKTGGSEVGAGKAAAKKSLATEAVEAAAVA